MDGRGWTRFVTLSVLGASLLGLPALVPVAAHGAACPGRTVDGSWTLLAPPVAADGQVEVRAFDVSWRDHDLVFVTDGRVVARTTDGGCTWDELWRIELPPTPEGAREVGSGWTDQVRIVEVAADPWGDPDRFTVLVHDATTPIGGTVRVLRSEDGGRTVTQPSVPPAPVAEGTFGGPCPPQSACDLEVSRVEPGVLYLTAAPGPIAPGGLWRSTDGGDTWSAVAVSAGRGDPWDTTFRGIAPFVSAPARAGLAFAGVGCRTVERSLDGGETWSPVDVPLVDGGLPVAIDVAQPPRSDPALVVVQHDGYCSGARIDAVHLSRDDGRSWRTAHLAGEDVEGVALDRSGQVAAVTDETGRAWLVARDGTTAAVRSPSGSPLRQPRAVGTADGLIAFASDRGVALLAHDVTAPLVPQAWVVPDPPDTGTCDEASPSAVSARPPVLEVAHERLVVGVGDRAEVEVSLEVPPGPAPVDVFAVLDASGSMQDAIDNLAATVVASADALAAERVDLHLGVAEFRSRNTVPYRRLLAVAPVDCRAPRALAAIEPQGEDETHLIALHQAVTGAGLPALGVPAGWDARFRAGALRLVLHATDEPVGEGAAHDPGLDEVAGSFRSAAVGHVGIRVHTDVPADTGPTGLDATRASLDRVGAAIGTTAPAGGIDCDGDGLIDVPAGQPVTCSFGGAAASVGSEGIGGVLVQVVKGLLRPQTLRVQASGADVDVHAEVPVTRADRRDGASTRGRLHVTCPDRPVRDAVEVHGLVDDHVVASGHIEVVCVAPGGAVHAPTLGASAAAVPLAPTGGPPPPAPVPGAAAAPAGASASASASATSASSAGAAAPASGLSAADETEPEVATSFVDTRSHPNPTVPAGAAALLAATAALHRRTDPRTREQRP